MHRTKIMGFLLGVSATLVVAQPEYDLPRLEALAMESSRSVLAAREQITAARYAVDSAGAFPNPELEYLSGTSRSRGPGSMGAISPGRPSSSLAGRAQLGECRGQRVR
jgi:outer membrane protein, heavy metal efflux system